MNLFHQILFDTPQRIDLCVNRLNTQSTLCVLIVI
jgi:hypothetical protein